MALGQVNVPGGHTRQIASLAQGAGNFCFVFHSFHLPLRPAALLKPLNGEEYEQPRQRQVEHHATQVKHAVLHKVIEGLSEREGRQQVTQGRGQKPG